MLDTVRAFAASELSAAERDDALAGLARYCLAEATLTAQGLLGPTQVNWLNRSVKISRAIAAHFPWLIERGRAGDASSIASILNVFWAVRGCAAEGLWWFEQILILPAIPLPPKREPSTAPP